MKKFISIVTLILALVSFPPAAHALETTGNPTSSDIALATDYQKIADSFGDFQLAFIRRAPDMLMAEYVLKTETTANWTQLVTANFFGASDDPDLHEKEVAKMISGWSGLLDDKTPNPLPPPQKISFETLDRPPVPPATEPLHGAIFQYKVGDSDKQEDNAAIIHAFPHPAGIVVFQYQRRNHGQITADDMSKMRYILNWSLSTLNAQPLMSLPPQTQAPPAVPMSPPAIATKAP